MNWIRSRGPKRGPPDSLGKRSGASSGVSFEQIQELLELQTKKLQAGQRQEIAAAVAQADDRS